MKLNSSRTPHAHRPTLRMVLLGGSLLFLVLPIISLYYLRIYESALVRQTESEMISQAAFVGALYKHRVHEELARQGRSDQTYGIPVKEQLPDEERWIPIPAKLDLASDKIYPPRPMPLISQTPLDPVATTVGQDIFPILQDAQRTTLSGLKVLDYRGLVAAGKGEHGLSFAHTEEFQRASRGKSVSLIRIRRKSSQDSVPLDSIRRNANINVFVALPILQGERLLGVVWVNRTPTDLTQALYGKRLELTWTAMLLLGVAFFFTGLMSYTLTTPIQALLEKTRLIAQGKPEGIEPLKTPVTREIAELSESITLMARTIQRRTEYLQDFTAHISHALKTPLTAIQGSVELLQENNSTMTAEQRERFLANLATDTERMKRMIFRLLELAHAEMADPVQKTALLRQVLTDMKETYAHQGLTVKAQGSGSWESLQVRMSAESLEAILTNLLDNSLQAGASQVVITVQQTSPLVTLLLQDNGSGISEGNCEAIFTPFFTTRQNRGGTGLGLSVTSTLLERHGGRIQLQTGTQGACFLVELPIS